jgi:hypothetical protein
MVCDVLAVQLFASLMSMVCEPLERPPNTCPEVQVANAPLSREHWNGLTPLMVTVMLPSLPPLQLTSVFVELATT